MKQLPRYVGAVDPGQSTGVAVYDREEGRIRYIGTTDFFGVVDWFERRVVLPDLFVVVEVAGKFMYGRNDSQDSKVRDRILIESGGTRREALLLAELLKREAFMVKQVPPIRQEKWTADQFRAMCRSDRATNQHERDAARLAWHHATKKK